MVKVESQVKIIDAQEGIVRVTPKRKKVAILGAGKSRHKAPFNDNDWEFWGLNEIPQDRAERWFELHPVEVQTYSELEWLKNSERPVYLLELDKEIPQGVRYPIEKVLSVEGAKDYFTSTFAYQVALAIYEGFEEIGLWGVPFFIGSPREQTFERTCLEWWLGLAIGKGMKVTIVASDKLMYHPHRYGYDYYEEKRYVEGTMSYLGKRIHTFQDHLIPDGGSYQPVGGGGDFWLGFD